MIKETMLLLNSQVRGDPWRTKSHTRVWTSPKWPIIVSSGR